MNFIMKNLIISLGFLLLMIFTPTVSSAQETATTTSSNYYKANLKPRVGIYLIGGVTAPFTDVVQSKKPSYAIGIQGLYKATYFLDALLDFQVGKMTAGIQPTTQKPKRMQFENQIFSVSLVGHVSPLKFMNNIYYNSALYYLSNIYVGTGLGIVKSKVNANLFTDPNFEYIGNYEGTDLMLPIDFGINLPMFEMKKNQKLSLSVNYRFCFVMGDKIDGYITPKTINEKNDVINLFNVGIGYNF